MSKVTAKIADVLATVMTAELENQGINVETKEGVVEFIRFAVEQEMLEDWFLTVPSEDGEVTLTMEDVIFAIETGDLTDNAEHVFRVMGEQVKANDESADTVMMGVTNALTGEEIDMVAGDLYALLDEVK